MKGPRRARMPVYGAGSKYLGCTEKETEWLRFHAPQAPGNSHCTPTVELIRRHVEHVNANLARYEAIRRWAILPAELKVETGELTPSLKVRRRVVEQRYRDVLEGLYAEAPQGAGAPWELR
jgi:hypothetical protein